MSTEPRERPGLARSAGSQGFQRSHAVYGFHVLRAGGFRASMETTACAWYAGEPGHDVHSGHRGWLACCHGAGVGLGFQWATAARNSGSAGEFSLVERGSMSQARSFHSTISTARVAADLGERTALHDSGETQGGRALRQVRSGLRSRFALAVRASGAFFRSTSGLERSWGLRRVPRGHALMARCLFLSIKSRS
jgi:hypothetical protein